MPQRLKGTGHPRSQILGWIYNTCQQGRPIRHGATKFWRYYAGGGDLLRVNRSFPHLMGGASAPSGVQNICVTPPRMLTCKPSCTSWISHTSRATIRVNARLRFAFIQEYCALWPSDFLYSRNVENVNTEQNYRVTQCERSSKADIRHSQFIILRVFASIMSSAADLIRSPISISILSVFLLSFFCSCQGTYGKCNTRGAQYFHSVGQR